MYNGACNIFMSVCLCARFRPKCAVDKDQTLSQQSSYLVALSWVRRRGWWASWEMRQCTIMCCHHGNRIGRAEANIRPRSHAQSGYDETNTSTSWTMRCVSSLFKHHSQTETHTQPPSVLPCVTSTDRHVVRQVVTHERLTQQKESNNMQTEWKEDGGNVNSMHTTITHLTHLLPQ